MMRTAQLPYGERRLNRRTPCTRAVQINDRDTSFSGYLRDLAVGGACIEAPYLANAHRGQTLLLTIPFGLIEDRLNITAKVAWSGPDGTGVRFISPQTGA